MLISRFVLLITTLAAAFATTGCAISMSLWPPQTRAPAEDKDGISEISCDAERLGDAEYHNRLVGYANSLVLREVTHYGPFRGDLVTDTLVGDSIVSTVLAKGEIEPTKGSLHNTNLWKKGRVIARLVVHSTDSVVVSKNLTLPPDTSWIAVCSHPKPDSGGDPTSSVARPSEAADVSDLAGSSSTDQKVTTVPGLIIPNDTSRPLRQISIKIVKPVRPERYALAYFAGGRTTVCVSCERHSWCHIQ